MTERAQTGIEQRRDPRFDLSGQVAIEFDAGTIVGPGQNVSQQGVFFTAPASIQVHVRIPGRAAPIPGELVRVESMGDGSVGLAVRFAEAHPELVP